MLDEFDALMALFSVAFEAEDTLLVAEVVLVVLNVEETPAASRVDVLFVLMVLFIGLLLFAVEVFAVVGC